MDNWIEAEEQELEERRKFSIDERRRLDAKKAKIKDNFLAHREKYTNFMNELFNLTDRVNNLPESKRADYHEIEGRTKESPLDNKLTIFTGSKRVELKLFTGLFSGYDMFKYKHVRVIYLFVSKEMGKIEIEYKESFYPKGHNKKYKKGRKHDIFRYSFDNLDEKLAMAIIEWLAFRKDFEEIPFNNKESFRWKR